MEGLRLRALLRRPSGPLTLLPPDRDGRPRRPGGARGGLSPDTLRLLQALALDEESTPFPPGPPSPGTPENPSGRAPSPPPLADPTPDLLLPHHSPPPAGDPGTPPDAGGPTAPPEPSPSLGPSLRHSLGRLLSGSGDPQEDEWDVIACLATACSGVLEAIARGGHQLRELPNIGVQQSLSPAAPEDESQSLSEKVALLEAALKRLQDDLQEGHEAQQRLRAELRGLRRSTRRLQQGQDDANERLSRVTRLLRPPGTPETP
ncbi:signal-induced proliferation-associated protein 1-like [Cyanocitta cristata]